MYSYKLRSVLVRDILFTYLKRIFIFILSSLAIYKEIVVRTKGYLIACYIIVNIKG